MIAIGTSGWVYNHWRGVFYPEALDSDAWLPYYAERFATVEINNTFYGMPEPASVAAWRDRVPAGFVFAVKMHRYVTHMKNLLDPQEPVARFMDRVTSLGDKLGPVLIQLPPRWHVNVARLEQFIPALPAGHRYAFEFRDASWYTEEVAAVLRRADCAFCIHDHASAPAPDRVTADFVYLRFHGPSGRYTDAYGEEALRRWAERIRAWTARDLDVYAYFNNDHQGYAVNNAQTLKALLAA